MAEQADAFDPGPAASILAQAWRSGAILSELPADVRPRTMLQGYDIQDRLAGEIGQTTVGWKLGVGSAALKRQSGVGRSIAGRIFERFVFRHGDTIPLPIDAPVTVEFEIAYVLGRDIEPGEAVFPLHEAIAETRVTFELVLSRFRDRRAVGWPSFAADNGGFQALVLGDAVDPSNLEALARTLSVSRDGKEVARAVSGDDATDPLAAFQDLVATARERQMVLPKGSIVSTGTLSKPFVIAAPAADVTATFLGRTLAFKTKAGVGNS